ncbi:MAG: sialidase family protein [Prevotellaceae bacterium]|nr:glycoside hydrolase [Prevotella sp.]MDD7257820.1 sialidase family protein [Prevotellaceae bacterium]MDY6131613.1 sialidase family protein [Prevotella sp.]
MAVGETYAQRKPSGDTFTVTVFDNANSKVPYRIPALAQARDGRLLAFCDYRISKTDIGHSNRNGLFQINEVMKVSDDFGRTWSDTVVVARGEENAVEEWYAAFGDPSVVADRTSDRVLMHCVSGKVGYFQSERNHPQHAVFFHSKDGGRTWDRGTDKTEMIYGLYDNKLPGGKSAAGIFLTSGRIMQSRYVKVGDFYRLYIAHPVRTSDEHKFATYVICSDDFGITWQVLGGAGVIPSDAADESKIEELPDGSVLLSCRNQWGGRKYNVFTYSDAKTAQGKWSKDAMPENMTGEEVNACNGETLVLPVIRTKDRKRMYVALQSVPLSKVREKVGFFYKELASPEDYDTGEKLASNWQKGLQVTELESCYSTMILMSNNRIGFLYEESLSNEGYNIVFKSLGLEEITKGKYRLDTALADGYKF